MKFCLSGTGSRFYEHDVSADEYIVCDLGDMQDYNGVENKVCHIVIESVTSSKSLDQSQPDVKIDAIKKQRG